MDKSIFTDKSKKPAEKDLKKELKDFYESWSELKTFVFQKNPEAAEEWNFSSFGWK
jgi:hypothetical protein